LHVDPSFARRSPFGECIVHGCLLALGMLGCIPSRELKAGRALRVSFAGPLDVDDLAHATAAATDGAWEVKAFGRGRPLARLRLASESVESANVVDAVPGLSPRPSRSSPATDTPASPGWGDPQAVDYHVRPELQALADRIGAGSLPKELLNGLAWASYVAGMEVPGLYGLLTGVSLRLSPAARGVDGGMFAPKDFDERTGRIVVMSALSGEAGVTTAEIESFARSAPQAPAASILQPIELPRQSPDASVVVVGASRGLGASLALAFAARQYDVFAVYAKSTAAANEMRELAGDDAGRLVLHRADAGDRTEMDALAKQLSASGRPVRAIVLAAAPPPGSVALAADGVGALMDYVAASVRLVATPLASLLPVLEPGGTVVFCSSVALTAPPRDWPHYTAAKGAVEGLAGWFAAANPQATAVVVRLPKMLTDMTNTPAGRIGAVAVEPVASWLAETVLSETVGPGLVTLETPPALGDAQETVQS
jgi:NAD(P)-dependent dehydrogenase (short-subunit alcohol dehydrogenase family)